MIHEAYMPVYMGSRFLARTDGTGRTGPIKGSTRGPRGPKNRDHMKMLVYDCLLSSLPIWPLHLSEFDNGIVNSTK